MTELFSLDGRVALVTGASRGLGLAMAAALHQAGATVVLNGRDAESLRRAAATIAADGERTDVAAFDVADETAAKAAVADIVARHGRLDILINNAGINSRQPFLEQPTEDWRRILEVNLHSVYLLAKLCAAPMVDAGWGRIVNIGSVMSVLGRPGIHAYSAAKHGLVGLTKSVASELGPRGVTCNAIGPGYFRTELTQALQDDKAFHDLVCRVTPVGRWGNPEELGAAAVFLCSPGAAYVNGHLLMIDGGMTTSFL
ncbi:glucose 1-dehydrogenase [Marinibaculum pumilum]|uniref:Glucose 1-dehydrogenase n=1 Tax=Marinibaculum pumilum TaxID=1766165 RepID=A0ABV7KXC1_9PROT